MCKSVEWPDIAISLPTQRPVQRSVHIVTGTDEREMGKRLGEVPQRLTSWSNLFSIQSDMIRVG
jgi:hypothetical protein